MSTTTTASDSTNVSDVAPRHETQSQFSLFAAFQLVSALAVVFAVVSLVPRERTWDALLVAPTLAYVTVLFAVLPIVLANMLCWLLVRNVPAFQYETDAERNGLHPFAPHRMLLLASRKESGSWRLAWLVALTSCVSCAFSWCMLKSTGIQIGPGIYDGLYVGWRRLIPNFFEMFGDFFSYNSFMWESYTLSRLWILFALITLAWTGLARLLPERFDTESTGRVFRRLLLFAPWFVVLDIAFLVGVWTDTSNVVPEPSTGFVEGIFSWDKWYWNCWHGTVWIKRGMLPTFAVGLLFSRFVLRWSRTWAIAGGATVVPLVIWISIAWSVQYNSFLKLGFRPHFVGWALAGVWISLYGPAIWRVARRNWERFRSPQVSTSNS